MDQMVVNWLLGGFGALIGFLLNSVWQAVKDLQEADRAIVKQVASIEVLVAGAYVKRDEFSASVYSLKEEFTRNTVAIFATLARIEDKLDKKVDKRDGQ